MTPYLLVSMALATYLRVRFYQSKALLSIGNYLVMCFTCFISFLELDDYPEHEWVYGQEWVNWRSDLEDIALMNVNVIRVYQIGVYPSSHLSPSFNCVFRIYSLHHRLVLFHRPPQNSYAVYGKSRKPGSLRFCAPNW